MLEKLPFADFLRTHESFAGPAVVSFLGSNSVGYVFLAFIAGYGTNALSLDRNFTLNVLLIGRLTWLGSRISFACLLVRRNRSTY